MQNSTVQVFKKRASKFQNFFHKLHTAYLFLKSPKSFVVIEKQIRAFNVSAQEVGEQCERIHSAILDKEIQTEEARIDKAIHQLVYLN